MGKGGKETTSVELDPRIVEAAEANLNLANEVGAIGMAPYSGPSIAGFAPQQMAAMQGIDQSAAAFGMPSAVNWQQGAQGGGMPGGQPGAPAGLSGGAPGGQGAFQQPQGMTNDQMYSALTGMQPPNASMGGFTGYSPKPLFDAAKDALPAAQRGAIDSFVMNPETGAAPTNRSVPAPQTQFNRRGQVVDNKNKGNKNKGKSSGSGGGGKSRGANNRMTARQRFDAGLR